MIHIFIVFQMESFGNVFACNGDTYEPLSYIDLSDCSSLLSPQSLLSPSSSTLVMSPPAQQVPQEENLYDRMIDSNMFYDKTEGKHYFIAHQKTYDKFSYYFLLYVVLKKPTLKIIDQPTKEFRFRYKSETGTHGCISGRSRKKSFPAVQVFLTSTKDCIEFFSLFKINFICSS